MFIHKSLHQILIENLKFYQTTFSFFFLQYIFKSGCFRGRAAACGDSFGEHSDCSGSCRVCRTDRRGSPRPPRASPRGSCGRPVITTVLYLIKTLLTIYCCFCLHLMFCRTALVLPQTRHSSRPDPPFCTSESIRASKAAQSVDTNFISLRNCDEIQITVFCVHC